MKPDDDISGPSRKQVKKATSYLRACGSIDAQIDADRYLNAWDVIDTYRALHYAPMQTCNVALRGYCSRLHLDATVSQRLKRMETIVDKIARHPNMDLTRMQDLGGCRVVFASLDDLWRLQERLLNRHPEAKVNDYVAEPRESGYRAVHVITQWGPHKRTIEIQLRTTLMHQWANMIEQVSGALGINYKQDGREDFQLWAASLSRILEASEKGEPLPRDVMEDYTRTWAVLKTDMERGELR